jgi:hypothetical protein
VPPGFRDPAHSTSSSTENQMWELHSGVFFYACYVRLLPG